MDRNRLPKVKVDTNRETANKKASKALLIKPMKDKSGGPKTIGKESSAELAKRLMGSSFKPTVYILCGNSRS